MPLTLSLREQPTVPLEAEGLSPDRLAGLRRAEVEALGVWHGNRRAQLADFFTRFLFPRAEIVVDMHSGGRSSICPPWSEMHLVDDAEQRRQMVEGMLAWNSDFH